MVPGNAIPGLMDSFVGSTVDGRYLIQEKIGEGGVGAVYLAQDLKMMKRQVVIKVLLENWLKNVQVRRKFEHEKEALSRLDHPAIVGILDAGLISGDKPYFVMPYVPGRTLEEIINENGPQSLAYSADVIETLADALSAAHSNGILHRDIKPENIIISGQADSKPRVRLIDFGIARVLDSKVSPVTLVERSIGTVWFVSPEQLLGNVEQTPAGDIYSLGVVAYVMLTGRRPFEPQSIVHMAMIQKDGLQVLPSAVFRKLSPEVDRIISRALAYDPAKRYQNAADFGRELCSELRHLSRIPTGPVTDNNVILPTVTSVDIENDFAANALGNTSMLTKFGEEREAQPPLRSGAAFRGKKLWIPLAVIGIFVIALAAALPSFIGDMPATNVVSAPPGLAASPSPPSLSLLFEIRKKRGGIVQDESATGIESDVFETGDEFRMIIESSKPGNLYVFNEDYINAGRTIFNILFPTKKVQNGFPKIDEGKSISVPAQPDVNIFTRSDGKEVVWVVWAGNSISELEEARNKAVQHPDGVLLESDRVAELKAFLENYSNDNLAIEKTEGENRKRVVTGKGNVLVYKIELEHRRPER